MSAWLAAFALTQLVETPIYARRLVGRRHRWLIAFAASTLTHPFIFLVLPRWWSGDWQSYFLAAEAIAVCVEAGWLACFGVRAPLLVALVANAASVIVGQTCRAVFGWP